MNKSKSFRVGMVSIIALLAVAVLWQSRSHFVDESNTPRKIKSTTVKSAAITKRARQEYFQRMLRDPATGQIPRGIRNAELDFANRLNRLAKSQGTATLDTMFLWKEAGPNDVGGRTRAVVIDVSNTDVLIAGGVAGGLWKSIDGGVTWALKSDPNQALNITSIAQDKGTGFTHIWYAVTGEMTGTTFTNVGYLNRSFGSGFYKSTNSGDTWTLIQSADEPSSWDSKFDMVMRVVVNRTTGHVYIATNNLGVYRSTNGGVDFTGILGNNLNDHSYSDVAVDANGTVYAVINHALSNTNTLQQARGVYRTTDGGFNWTDITPDGYPEKQERSVLALPASNTNALYMMTYIAKTDDKEADDVRLYKFDIATNPVTSVELTSSLTTTPINTQWSYNMVLAVKPDDEDYVIIGGTRLYRSSNGFDSAPEAVFANIGGYKTMTPLTTWANHHPDQQTLVFKPGSPNVMYSGHDGGISKTDDVTATAATFVWTNLSSGFNVTQFYTITQADESGDTRIIGGTQDNGSPYFLWNGTNPDVSVDASSGDGAFAYLGNDYYYASGVEGDITRYGYTTGNVNDLKAFNVNLDWETIMPASATGQLFINPFAVDPNDEDVIYYPAGNSFWRHTSLSTIPDGSISWENVAGLAAPEGYVITALQVSQSTPTHVLYYGGTGADAPKIYRIESANTATTGVTDRSIAGAAAGAYVANIAVHPDNADEIAVVLSNYNVVSLYHSTDGGQTYTDIEGNLAGSESAPGPSFRWLTMLPITTGETAYMLATSIGLFGTTTLNGASTVWEAIAPELIGNVAVSSVASRASDLRIVIGTHGRGAFVGAYVGSALGLADVGNGLPKRVTLNQNYPNPFNPSTSINFDLPASMPVELIVYNLQGREVVRLVDGQMSRGFHSVEWQGRDAAGRSVATGMYIARLVAPGYAKTIKMLFIK